MVPLPGATARAAYAPSGACDGASGRMGSPWCSQPGWKGGPVAPRRRWQWRRQQPRGRAQQQVSCLLQLAIIAECISTSRYLLAKSLRIPRAASPTPPALGEPGQPSRSAHLMPRSCSAPPSLPQTHAALLDPPPFDPAKLRIEFLPGGREAALSAGPRRYTLTHNDVTGSLQLSIGAPLPRAGAWEKETLLQTKTVVAACCGRMGPRQHAGGWTWASACGCAGKPASEK